MSVDVTSTKSSVATSGRTSRNENDIDEENGDDDDDNDQEEDSDGDSKNADEDAKGIKDAESKVSNFAMFSQGTSFSSGLLRRGAQG